MTHLESFIFQNAYSYEAYRQLIDQRFSDHKTTGIDHSESMLNYTSLNIATTRTRFGRQKESSAD